MCEPLGDMRDAVARDAVARACGHTQKSQVIESVHSNAAAKGFCALILNPKPRHTLLLESGAGWIGWMGHANSIRDYDGNTIRDNHALGTRTVNHLGNTDHASGPSPLRTLCAG